MGIDAPLFIDTDSVSYKYSGDDLKQK